MRPAAAGSPSTRTVRRALGVLQRLPPEALAELVERLVDSLDALDGDPDLEPEVDHCEADDAAVIYSGFAR